MRIVIDLQGAQTKSRFRGIGRYTLSFTRALIQHNDQHEFLLVLNGLFAHTIQPIRDQFEGLLAAENILVWHAPGPVSNMALGNKWRHEVAELIREAFIESLQPDLVHISSFLEGYVDSAICSIGKFDTSTPVSASLYDLIPLTNPQQYLDPYPLFKAFYMSRIEQLRHANTLLAISDFCRTEGLQNLEVNERQLINVSSAVEPSFQRAADYPDRLSYFGETFGINRSYMLYTGGADERKNLPRIIQAFAALPEDMRRAHQLVFAGKLLSNEANKLKREAKSSGLKGDEFILTGYVTDQDLIQLYSRCVLYVFPSWHEGFGLPALEAMACGAPVLAARSSSLVEVIDNDDALFDPFSVTDMTLAITRALSDSEFRNALARHGIEQARRFSWEKTAHSALDAWSTIKRDRVAYAGDSDIMARLIDQLAKLPCNKEPTDLQLARIADCIDRNAALAKTRGFRRDPSPSH
jgi:glycosyltransferase involved in cell wall biosynthesis